MTNNGKRFTPWLCTVTLLGGLGIATVAADAADTKKQSAEDKQAVQLAEAEQRDGEATAATEKSETTSAKANKGATKVKIVVAGTATGAKASQLEQASEATEKSDVAENGVDRKRLGIESEMGEKSEAMGAKATPLETKSEMASSGETTSLRARQGSTGSPMPGKPSLFDDAASPRNTRSAAPGKPSMVQEGRSSSSARSSAPGKPTLHAPGRSASTPSQASASSSRNAARQNVEFMTDICFDQRGQWDHAEFDAAWSANAQGQSMPLVVFLTTKSSSDRRAIESIASEGYFVASINLGNAGTDIDSTYDYCCDAISHLVSNASEYGFDSEHIAIWGSDWAGHMAAMLGTASNNRSFSRRSSWRQSVDCVVTMGAPLDLEGLASTPSGQRSIERWYGSSFDGSSREMERWSPLSHVDGQDAAFMIFHGANDRAVPFDQAAAMADALEGSNVQVKFQPMSGASSNFNSPDAVASGVAFMDSHFGANRFARSSQRSSDRSAAPAVDRSNSRSSARRSTSRSNERSSNREATIITTANADR